MEMLFMLLFASSNCAAYALVSALKAVELEAGVGRERSGRFPVYVNGAEDREAQVLAIAEVVDPSIQVAADR